MAAGFPPHTFWEQTERSFFNALTGAAEHRIAVAWQHEFFARQDKLRGVSHYLKPGHTPREGAQALLSAALSMQRRGVQMTIEKIPLPANAA